MTSARDVRIGRTPYTELSPEERRTLAITTATGFTGILEIALQEPPNVTVLTAIDSVARLKLQEARHNGLIGGENRHATIVDRISEVFAYAEQLPIETPQDLGLVRPEMSD